VIIHAFVNKPLNLNQAFIVNVSFITNHVKDGLDISHVTPVIPLDIRVPHFLY
jgi:hypothetical protein